MTTKGAALVADVIRVSLHLNANTDAHWAFWLNFLRQHPEITCVSIEFQTGALLDQDFGQYTFEQIVYLQNQLGQRLHFLLVGAARFYPRAVAELKSFSLPRQPALHLRHQTPDT